MKAGDTQLAFICSLLFIWAYLLCISANVRLLPSKTKMSLRVNFQWSQFSFQFHTSNYFHGWFQSLSFFSWFPILRVMVIFSSAAQVGYVRYQKAAPNPSTAEKALMWRRGKRPEECISQDGKGWRGEPELCLSQQPEMPPFCACAGWRSPAGSQGILTRAPGQAGNPCFSQIFIIWDIQLSKLPRSLWNSKNAASLVSVKNVCHIVAEISMFPRNVLVIWVFSIREKVLLRDYWKSLHGGLRHVTAYRLLKSNII